MDKQYTLANLDEAPVGGVVTYTSNRGELIRVTITEKSRTTLLGETVARGVTGHHPQGLVDVELWDTGAVFVTRDHGGVL